MRHNRGASGHRATGASGGYNYHQQQYDESNSSTSNNIWTGSYQTISGCDRFQQQTSGGNGNRQQEHSWWDSTS